MSKEFTVMPKKITHYANLAVTNSSIDPELYTKYDVKRGLRDVSGQGVLTGLTEISKIKSYTLEDGDLIPCDGKLYYRGYDIEDIVKGFIDDKRFGFEETTYLLLFGNLPNNKELNEFNEVLSTFLYTVDCTSYFFFRTRFCTVQDKQRYFRRRAYTHWDIAP